LGPSGSGKSTLALLLDGVIPHAVEAHWESGSVRVDGTDTRATGLASLSSTVGVLFQDPETQLVMLEVDDEIAFGLENHAVPRAAMAGSRSRARRARRSSTECLGSTSWGSGSRSSAGSPRCSAAMRCRSTRRTRPA